jgi:hypothetical protein
MQQNIPLVHRTHVLNLRGRTAIETFINNSYPSAFTIDAECGGAGVFDWKQFNAGDPNAAALAPRHGNNAAACRCSVEGAAVCRCWVPAFNADATKNRVIVYFGDIAQFFGPNNPEAIARIIMRWRAAYAGIRATAMAAGVSFLSLENTVPSKGTWYCSDEQYQIRPIVYDHEGEIVGDYWGVQTNSVESYWHDSPQSLEWRARGAYEVTHLDPNVPVGMKSWLVRARVKDAPNPGYALMSYDIVHSRVKPNAMIDGVPNSNSGPCLGYKDEEGKILIWRVTEGFTSKIGRGSFASPDKLRELYNTAVSIGSVQGHIKRHEPADESVWREIFVRWYAADMAKSDNTGCFRSWLIAAGLMNDLSSDTWSSVVAGGGRITFWKYARAWLLKHILGLLLIWIFLMFGRQIATGVVSSVDRVACLNCEYGLVGTTLAALTNMPHDIPRSDLAKWNQILRHNQSLICEGLAHATGQSVTSDCFSDPWSYFDSATPAEGQLYWSVTGLIKQSTEAYAHILAGPFIEELIKSYMSVQGSSNFGITFGVCEFLGAAAFGEEPVQENLELFLKSRVPALMLHIGLALGVNGPSKTNMFSSVMLHALFNAWALNSRVTDRVDRYLNVKQAEESVWGFSQKDSGQILFCETMKTAGACVDKYGNSWLVGNGNSILLVNKLPKQFIEKTALFRQMFNVLSKGLVGVDLVEQWNYVNERFANSENSVIGMFRDTANALNKSLLGRGFLSIVKLPITVMWALISVDSALDEAIGLENVETLVNASSKVINPIGNMTRPVFATIGTAVGSVSNYTVDSVYNATVNSSVLNNTIVNGLIGVSKNLAMLTLYNGSNAYELLDWSAPVNSSGIFSHVQRMLWSMNWFVPALSVETSMEFERYGSDWKVNQSSLHIEQRVSPFITNDLVINLTRGSLNSTSLYVSKDIVGIKGFVSLEVANASVAQVGISNLIRVLNISDSSRFVVAMERLENITTYMVSNSMKTKVLSCNNSINWNDYKCHLRSMEVTWDVAYESLEEGNYSIYYDKTADAFGILKCAQITICSMLGRFLYDTIFSFSQPAVQSRNVDWRFKENNYVQSSLIFWCACLLAMFTLIAMGNKRVQRYIVNVVLPKLSWGDEDAEDAVPKELKKRVEGLKSTLVELPEEVKIEKEFLSDDDIKKKVAEKAQVKISSMSKAQVLQADPPKKKEAPVLLSSEALKELCSNLPSTVDKPDSSEEKKDIEDNQLVDVSVDTAVQVRDEHLADTSNKALDEGRQRRSDGQE